MLVPRAVTLPSSTPRALTSRGSSAICASALRNRATRKRSCWIGRSSTSPRPD